MEPKETSYMLFIFGDYKNGEKYIESIMSEFTPIITTDYLKFVWGDYGVVVHFKSDLNFNDLAEFVSIQLELMVDQYFLLEKTDNVSAFGPEEIVGYVLDLDSNLKRPTVNKTKDEEEKENELNRIIEYFMSNISEEENEKLFDMDDDDMDDDEIKMIQLSNNKNKSLTLDQILDKITEKGFKSLSKKEKQQLEKYANGK